MQKVLTNKSLDQIESLIYRIHESRECASQSYINQAFYSDNANCCRDEKENVVDLWILNQIRDSIINGSEICLTEDEVSKIASFLIREGHCDMKIHSRKDISFVQSSSYIAENPNCLGGPAWFRFANMVCDVMKVDIKIEPLSCIADMTSKSKMASLIYDIQIEQITCDFAYVASVYAENCKTEFDLKREKIDCEMDIGLISEKINCETTSDISIIEQCKENFEINISPICDMTFDTYLELLDCKMNTDLMVRLLDCNIELSANVEKLCVFAKTESGNIYNLNELFTGSIDECQFSEIVSILNKPEIFNKIN